MFRLPLAPKWIRYLLVATIVTLIITFSIVPLPRWVTDTGPLGLLPIRQYLHFIAYGGFAIVLGYALADADRPDWQLLLFVFVAAFTLGFTMELLQLTLPHRTASTRDLLMNAAGAALAVGLWRVVLSQAKLYRLKTREETLS